jgi:predicted RNase H-like HicB family nuclease
MYGGIPGQLSRRDKRAVNAAKPFSISSGYETRLRNLFVSARVRSIPGKFVRDYPSLRMQYRIRVLPVCFSVLVGTCVKSRIVIEQDEDGVFGAECSTLPGCESQGKTRNEAPGTIREAMEGYLHQLIRRHMAKYGCNRRQERTSLQAHGSQTFLSSTIV